MSSHRPTFAIFLTPPPEDQPSCHQRQTSTSSLITMPSGTLSSSLLNARLEEARFAIQQKKEWEELTKHRKLRPTVPKYDLAFLSPLSAAKSRKSRKSRSRRSQRNAAADTNTTRSVPRENVVVPAVNDGGLQRTEGRREGSGAVETMDGRRVGMEVAIAGGTARKPARPSFFFARKAATNEDSSADNTSTTPEEFIVTHQEPSTQQVLEGVNAIAAPKLRKVRAIYPEPSKEDGRNDRGGLSRRFGGIDSILFGDMGIRGSVQSAVFGSQMGGSVDNSLIIPETAVSDATTVETSAEEGVNAATAESFAQETEATTEKAELEVEAEMKAEVKDERKTEVDDHEKEFTTMVNKDASDFITVIETSKPSELGESDSFVGAVKDRAAGDLGSKITGPVPTRTAAAPRTHPITVFAESELGGPNASDRNRGGLAFGKYFRKLQQHFSSSPEPTKRQFRPALTDMLKTQCRAMSGFSWSSTGLGGDFGFLGRY